MRTRTIFKAMGKAIDEAHLRYMPGELERRKRLRRMADTFKAELLRRMDERDTLVEQLASSNDKITDFENEACHQMEMLDG